jgi:hypothetical protein
MADRRYALLGHTHAGGGSGVSWGGITGTLSAQTDLQSALDAKAATSHTHVAANINAESSTDGWVLTSDGAGNAAWEVVPATGGTAWGGITGTLSAQTDLQAALDLKAPLASPTFTGTVRVNSAGNFYIYDSDNNAGMRMYHTGTTAVIKSHLSTPTLNLNGWTTVTIDGATTLSTGTITASGNVTGANLNISNWDAAYTYSQVGHLPLAGGTVSGDTNFQAASNGTMNLYITEAGVGFVGAQLQYDGAANELNIMTGNNPPVTRMTIPRDSGAITMPGSLAVTGAVTGSNLNVSNWDTAFGWGNHASEGYAPLASPTFTGTVAMGTLNAGNIDSTGTITASIYFKTDAANGNGIGFWNGAPSTYGIFMSQASVQGRIATDTTSDYNMYFEMNNGGNRGFVWEADGTKLFAVQPDGVRSALWIQTAGADTAPAAGYSRLSANMLHIDGKEAIDGNDTLLRLNQNSDFSGGIYTPGGFKMDGNLFLKERAAATGDQTTYGQVWIKSNTPQELWFTTEDGVDHHVAGGSLSETFGVVKTTTEDVTSSTTLQNDDELAVAMAANSVYSVTMVLEVQAVSLTPDFKFDFAIPTGADGAYTFNSCLSGGSSYGTIGASADWTTDQTVSLGSSGTRTIIVLHGTVVTSSTAGDLQLRWAQNTSSIDTVFVRSGSSLMLVTN